jgi:hypothetical protein
VIPNFGIVDYINHSNSIILCAAFLYKGYNKLMETKTFTNSEIDALFSSIEGDFQRDNSGQVIIYTNIFEWDDGTFHNVSDPLYEDK